MRERFTECTLGLNSAVFVPRANPCKAQLPATRAARRLYSIVYWPAVYSSSSFIKLPATRAARRLYTHCAWLYTHHHHMAIYSSSSFIHMRKLSFSKFVICFFLKPKSCGAARPLATRGGGGGGRGEESLNRCKKDRERRALPRRTPRACADVGVSALHALSSSLAVSRCLRELCWCAGRGRRSACGPQLHGKLRKGMRRRGEPAARLSCDTGLVFLTVKCFLLPLDLNGRLAQASLPPDVIASVRSTGLLSYKYKTRKGLSTKVFVPLSLSCPCPCLSASAAVWVWLGLRVWFCL